MKKVAEKFVFLEYFSYLCTINKIRIKYIRDIMINFSKFNSLYSVATYFNTEEKCQQVLVEFVGVMMSYALTAVSTIATREPMDVFVVPTVTRTLVRRSLNQDQDTCVRYGSAWWQGNCCQVRED